LKFRSETRDIWITKQNTHTNAVCDSWMETTTSKSKEAKDVDNHKYWWQQSTMSGAPSSLIRVLYRVAILLWLCTTTLRFANMLPQPPSTHSRIILKAPPVAPPTVSLPPPPPTTQSSIGNGLAVISPHKCQRKNYTRSTAPRRRSEVRRKSQGTSQTEIDPDHSLEERDMDNCSMEACFGTEGDPDFLESMVSGESGRITP
jgi:hypothetical protein